MQPISQQRLYSDLMTDGMQFKGTVWDLVGACNSENDPLLSDKLYLWYSTSRCIFVPF